MRAVWVLSGIAVFGALLWFAASGQARVECEVCVTFKGRTECRSGQGADRDVAIGSASTAACALLGRGVTDAMQCGASQPRSVRCSER